MWICSKCKEELEDQFESCWNCQTGRDGRPLEIPIVEPTLDRQVKETTSKTFIQLPPLPSYPSATRPLAVLLSRYIGTDVGINYSEPKEFSSANLLNVTDDFISIYVSEKNVTITYPLQQIVNIVEADGGVSTGVFFKKRYTVIIEVFHLVVYKGAVGFSIPIPMTSD
jgi:hypothetical protein